MSTAATAQTLDPAGAARILASALEAGEGLDAFIRLALLVGPRRAELVGILWPDFEWPTDPREAGTVLIACRDGGKTPLARQGGVSSRRHL